MKRKEKQELAEKTLAQLQKLEQDLQQKLTKAQMEKAAGKLANTSSVKLLADDLARVKTVLRLQQVTEQTAVPAADTKTRK
jgi:ribosomal protein L29